MNAKCWRVWSVAGVFLLAVLCGARAEDDKEKDVGKPAKKMSAEKFKKQSFDLKEKGKKEFNVSFPEDKEFVLTVKSKKESDINLFIYDKDKKEVAKDDSPGPSCDLKFTAKTAGTYRIVVVNKGPGENTSTLTIEPAKKKE